jgi:hypothetical protein
MTKPVLWIQIRDPLLFWPLDPDPGSEMKKNPDPGSEIGMNVPDHISESLEKNFRVKKIYLNSSSGFGSGIRDLLDPGSGMENIGSGIRNKHPGSTTLD